MSLVWGTDDMRPTSLRTSKNDRLVSCLCSGVSASLPDSMLDSGNSIDYLYQLSPVQLMLFSDVLLSDAKSASSRYLQVFVVLEPSADVHISKLLRVKHPLRPCLEHSILAINGWIAFSCVDRQLDTLF